MTGVKAYGRKGVVIAAVLLTAHRSPLTAQDPRIDSLFSGWARTEGPGCIAGVKQSGKTVHLKAYGMANLEYGVPLTTESVSESGSLAKQFTSAAITLLAKQGKLSLDDDIRKHLPEVPNFGRTITIRNLLTHTSGLRDQWALLGLAGWPPGTQVHSIPLILDLVSRQRMLNFEPGSLYLYSNTGYVLAATIVQRVSGKSLAEWSQDNLFQPLGMKNTEWRDDYRRVVKGRATAYSPVRNGAWQ
jgi:CubicO group peptidase (beta-lactamase class C family)